MGDAEKLKEILLALIDIQNMAILTGPAIYTFFNKIPPDIDGTIHTMCPNVDAFLYYRKYEK
jgi:hypothetical protein